MLSHRTPSPKAILVHHCCRWRQERKKNFPTAVNLAAKSQAAAERSAWGELEPERAERQRRLREVW